MKNFFETRPFQVSLVPGLGSHGKMSGQVVNNFSLNVFGGYTAGTNGSELGGLFNIDKKAFLMNFYKKIIPLIKFTFTSN